jgi:hypothetical protein
VLTVFSETDSSPAISGRDRFVGTYRSILSSPGLSSSAGGNEDCSLAAGDEPCAGSHGKYARKTAWCLPGRCAVDNPLLADVAAGGEGGLPQDGVAVLSLLGAHGRSPFG